MRNAHPKYMCFPSVVPIGKEVEITIVPRDNSRIFREEWNYTLGIAGLWDDMLAYGDRITKDKPVYIKEGCLCFKHTFTSEQEYTIRFYDEKNQKEVRTSVYAVCDDLYERRPLKGDLHAHSYYSDGFDGVTMAAANYREEGFDFFALADHNRMYTSILAKQLFDGVKLGINIMPGEEIHTPGSRVHIVHIGGSDSVCDKYIHQPDDFKNSVAEIEETLTHIPEQYRHRTALAKWAANEAHKVGGIVVFAHPFWQPLLYNVSKEFCDILFSENIFDAFEIAGGTRTQFVNVQHILWEEQRRKGNYLAPVGSSDSHDHDVEYNEFGHRFTIAFAKDNTTEGIIEAIKSGYTLAAEVPMQEGNKEVRFYGNNTRLVLFAHFLYNNYFNETWRLAIGEGILMRRYAEGEDVGEILSSLANTTENFYKKFYGLLPAPTIPAERKEFLDMARKLHLEIGPETKSADLWLRSDNQKRE